MRYLTSNAISRSYFNYLGRGVLRFLLTAQGLCAFALIIVGVIITKRRVAVEATQPVIRHELARSGQAMFPTFVFMALVLGLLVVGQSQAMGELASPYLGKIMVLVVVRELGPLLTAMMVLSRSGTANVIELGTSRALREVEALESLGIDPIHYLVMPRVVGMAMGVLSLTVYFVIGSLVSVCLWSFFMPNFPLTPGEYFQQVADALNMMDFVLLALKSSLFGVVIAVITCYHGLAQPLRLAEVSGATVRAVAQSVVACVLLDALFIIFYMAS